MKIFDFNPDEYAPAFARRGYVHIEKGLSENFFRLLSEQVVQTLEAGVMKDFALGDKQQALYRMPEERVFCSELKRAVGRICRINPERLLISERHVKSYDEGANPSPPPHKDRFASELAVGFPVHVPRDSALVLYPETDVVVNPFNSWAELREGIHPKHHPEKILKAAKPVEIRDSPGDVIVFRGSAIWHLRSNPAGTIILYLKLNSFNCDTLGEDPFTSDYLKVARTPQSLSDAELRVSIPLISRRVDSVQKRYNRDWRETLVVSIRGSATLSIDEMEFKALKLMDGIRSVGSVLDQACLGSGPESGLAMIQSLAQRGIIDLLQHESERSLQTDERP
jgi:hypothetical protein